MTMLADDAALQSVVFGDRGIAGDPALHVAHRLSAERSFGFVSRPVFGDHRPPKRPSCPSLLPVPPRISTVEIRYSTRSVSARSARRQASAANLVKLSGNFMIITALFDTRSDAEAAKTRLTQSRVDASSIHIHDKSSAGYNETGRSTHQDRGIWASIKHAFLPDSDRHTYEEGVRRGGVLLTADVGDDAVSDAVRLLEEANRIDIDERSQSWRASGWGADAIAPAATTAFGVDASGTDAVYGRREPDRGGLRARSYVNGPFGGTTDGAGSSSHDLGTKAAGLAKEAIGNVKQAAGGLFGSDEMKRDGATQERKGETQQGKSSDTFS